MSAGVAITCSWISGTIPVHSSAASPLTFLSPCSCSSSGHIRVICRSQVEPPSGLKLILHDALDSSGFDTTHAREAREGFCAQIRDFSSIERKTSIVINRGVDIGKTALYIAAEDDSLISHSSVPLPVEAFIDRLDDHSMQFCSQYSSNFRSSSPDDFFKYLEIYLYIDKGFRRSSSKNPLEQRALYLPSVLTHRVGSSVMLSLIYSEILKMLRLWGILTFDVEIFFPHDSHGLPKGYLKQKSLESHQPHILTSEALLVKTLRDLKSAFWPFQFDSSSRSLFLQAVDAADNSREHEEDSAFRLASAKAAQHRLERGVWTSVRLGDMRRALSACERLILMNVDATTEMRDYGALLYHCGFYEESMEYLKHYSNSKVVNNNKSSDHDSISSMEEDEAVEKLINRLTLVAMEVGWTSPPSAKHFLNRSSEPW